ncbi:MAG: hypothetical protein CVV27_13665 [Candidatus Melainabacteria bacterium HGW-Melainabacteria-1]|nr:MAG: hypothetical protein CVV27_13665 [Candidatus Melainabacteria bacterium HGW-Melainabacteria-1]
MRYARPGESLAFDGETWTQHCQSPNQPALPGMQQVLAPADLRRLPVLSDPAVRVEAASELARTQLQRRGWQTVLSALPTTAAAVISGMHLPESPYILLVYGDTTGWQLGLGALLALAPRLQALPGICLYLPPELSVSQEAIEDELVAEAEASGADESLDLELTLVPGQDLSQSERVELFARATLLLLPWTRWESGQPEWLLAKATNTPAIVQGLDPVLPTSWQVLTPFEQLQVISPDAPLPVTYEYLQELLHRQLQP